MTRNKMIAVSDAEKEQLDDFKERRFNSTEVPYGAAIQVLIEEYGGDS